MLNVQSVTGYLQQEHKYRGISVQDHNHNQTDWRLLINKTRMTLHIGWQSNHQLKNNEYFRSLQSDFINMSCEM